MTQAQWETPVFFGFFLNRKCLVYSPINQLINRKKTRFNRFFFGVTLSLCQQISTKNVRFCQKSLPYCYGTRLWKMTFRSAPKANYRQVVGKRQRWRRTAGCALNWTGWCSSGLIWAFCLLFCTFGAFGSHFFASGDFCTVLIPEADAAPFLHHSWATTKTFPVFKSRRLQAGSPLAQVILARGAQWRGLAHTHTRTKKRLISHAFSLWR